MNTLWSDLQPKQVDSRWQSTTLTEAQGREGLDRENDVAATEMRGDFEGDERRGDGEGNSNTMERIESQVSNTHNLPESNSEYEPGALGNGPYDESGENSGDIDTDPLDADEGRAGPPRL